MKGVTARFFWISISIFHKVDFSVFFYLFFTRFLAVFTRLGGYRGRYGGHDLESFYVWVFLDSEHIAKNRMSLGGLWEKKFCFQRISVYTPTHLPLRGEERIDLHRVG